MLSNFNEELATKTHGIYSFRRSVKTLLPVFFAKTIVTDYN